MSLFARLHRRWQTERIHTAILHCLAAGGFASVAAHKTPEADAHPDAWWAQSMERTKQGATVRSLFETASGYMAFAESNEPLASWMARDGHIEYLAQLFFEVLRPEVEPGPETGIAEEQWA